MTSLKEQSKTGSAILYSVQEQCHATPSRTWIEITRNSDEELPWETTSPFAPDFVKKAANEKKKAFQDYDIQRNAAYRLQIQLSAESTSSTVTVNALTVAKIVPFCVLVVIAIVTILGFQQSAYRRQLRFLLRNKQNDELSRAMAETQFLAPPFQPMKSLEKRFFELSPTSFGIGSLLIASVFLLYEIISTFALTLVQLTNSIILSYPFALYASLVLLSAALAVTRKSYIENSGQAECLDEDLSKRRSRASRWLAIVLGVLGMVSLVLPWANESTEDADPAFRGFEFLLNQQPIGTLFNYTTYRLSPPIFRDVRILVTIAVIFILICILDSLRPSSTNRIATFSHESRRILAACVFGLAIYYLAFMALLEYESLFWVPWLDRLSYQGSPEAFARATGFSLRQVRTCRFAKNEGPIAGMPAFNNRCSTRAGSQRTVSDPSPRLLPNFFE